MWIGTEKMCSCHHYFVPWVLGSKEKIGSFFMLPQNPQGRIEITNRHSFIFIFSEIRSAQKKISQTPKELLSKTELFFNLDHGDHTKGRTPTWL
jgi:hypothetical protein